MTFRINDKFWNYYQKLVADNVVEYQWQTLNDEIDGIEPSHAISNFKITAGINSGTYYGEVFQDSDVYKWLEMAAYSYGKFEDAELLQRIKQVSNLISLSQETDGYINTYYQIAAPDKKWTNLRDHHELYCAGHLFEAAVAVYQATGDDLLITVSEKFAVLIDSKYGYDDKKIKGYPGHQEIEIGLLRLFEITKKELYLSLADYFIKIRGANPNYFSEEAIGRDPKDLVWNDEGNLNFGLGYEYQQAHCSIYDQKEAVGHSVRAVYYYASIAHLCRYVDDSELNKKVQNLWKDIVETKLYITAGIGANANGESFGSAYDLPNDTMYCETCASVGLVFLADRLQDLNEDSEYGDIIERAIYNGILSGMNLNGNRFLYVNPLEINHKYSDDLRYKHVETDRVPWLKTACCPPNLGRLIASLDKYVSKIDEQSKSVYLNQFIGGRFEFGEIKFDLESDLPWNGDFKISITNWDSQYKLKVRKPAWATEIKIIQNNNVIAYEEKNGYLILGSQINEFDEINIEFLMPTRVIYSNPKVSYNREKVAIQRGPLLYALESIDNKNDIHSVLLKSNTEFTIVDDQIDVNKETSFDFIKLEFDAESYIDSKELYRYSPYEYFTDKITAVPYFLWNNRGSGDLKVWLNIETNRRKS